MNDDTCTLTVLRTDDTHEAESLLAVVYDELRQLAEHRLAREPVGQTLQATALVHEAYLRLLSGSTATHWNSRGHFFAAAAEAMRRILVDRARHKQTLKAGGGFRRQPLSEIQPAVGGPDLDLLALNEALDKLTDLDPRAAEVVKLRFFAGLTTAEAADVLGVSATTAENDWAHARCWLRLEMQAGEGD